MGVNVIVLAAGEGRRMQSRRPKVLADLAGRTLLDHVLTRADALADAQVSVVVGHGGDQVCATLPAHIQTVVQPRQQGTGDAVARALPVDAADATAAPITLVVYGDVPLVATHTLERLIEAAGAADLALLTHDSPAPGGYGRIVRGPGDAIQRIVEERDATEAERALREINTGLLAMPTGALARAVAALDCDNAQGEYYLTDIVAQVAAADGCVAGVQPGYGWEVAGVNNRAQLAALERAWQRHQADQLLIAGICLRDPDRIDIRGELTGGADTLIDVGCVFEGTVVLGTGVTIGAHCVIRDTTIADGSVIEPQCVVDQATIGARCKVGPFARLRPGSRFAAEARVGNFVETKNTDLGVGGKINHLAYIGDAAVGAGANIGAGTITCNFDGRNKHRTEIGDEAFVGSDCQLIAPVTIGAGATIGAGTTLTADAPARQLTVGRARQRTLSGWSRPEDRSDRN